MFVKKSGKPQNRIDSLIGTETRIEGDVKFTGGLRVDGAIKGNISATDEQHGTLVISEHACIEGDIHVAHLVINGTVTGSVSSCEFLELQPHAQVTGDVHYNSIEIHLGAVIQGRLVHQASAGKAIGLKLASNN